MAAPVKSGGILMDLGVSSMQVDRPDAVPAVLAEHLGVSRSEARRLLADPLFWISMRNTFYFVLVGGPLTLGVALAAALLLHSKLVRWKGLFRTIFFAPYITTLVAVAIVFRYLYHPRFGGLNRVLELLGIPAIDWLGNPKWAMPAIILLAIWKNFGYAMILFIAGLQAIPESLYEAARLDGAGPNWRVYADPAGKPFCLCWD